MLHKISSLSLALLVLVSTMSFTVEKHFCCGELVDFSLFSDVEKCMDNASSLMEVSLIQEDCCAYAIDVVHGQDNVVTHSDTDLIASHPFFVKDNNLSFLDVFTELSSKDIIFANYTSPNLIFDVQIMDQVFLI